MKRGSLRGRRRSGSPQFLHRSARTFCSISCFWLTSLGFFCFGCNNFGSVVDAERFDDSEDDEEAERDDKGDADDGRNDGSASSTVIFLLLLPCCCSS